MTNFTRTIFGLTLLAISAGIVIAACTGGSDPATCNDPRVDVSNVPEVQDGVLSIGSELGFEPMNFINSETSEPDGYEIEFARALANELCVDVRFVRTSFDGLLGSLNAGGFDVIIASMTITDERKAHADFIPYIEVGSAILVRSGNPRGVEKLEGDLCGLTVAVQSGTIQVGMLEEQQIACKEDGGDIDILEFGTHEATMIDLTVAGSEASITDYPVAFLAAKDSNGRLQLVEGQFEQEDYGIGVRRSSTQLNAALTQARDNLICSGTYDDLLEAWNLRASHRFDEDGPDSPDCPN